MTRMLTLIVGLCVVASGPALAQQDTAPEEGQTPRMYVSLDAGVSFVPDTDVAFFGVPSALAFDPGFTVGGEIGTQANSHLRLGLSLIYNRVQTRSARVGASARPGGQIVDEVRPLWNVYWDFSLLDDFLQPYVGVGLGAAYAGIDSTSLGYGDTSDWGLAYAVHLGTHVKLSDMWRVKVGYRYNGTGSLWNSELNFIKGNLTSHDIVVGATMMF